MITRLTDAANTISADTGNYLASIEVEYSTCSPFSKHNRWLLLKEGSYFGLYDLASRTRVRPLLQVDASSEPRWSIHDPDLFYFHKGNRLLLYHVPTDGVDVIGTFPEYTSISAHGESEIGEDGDSLVLAGGKSDVFVYRISSGIKGRVLNVTGWDSVSLSPDGNVILAANQINLFDSSMNHLLEIAAANGHRHVARNTDGKECLIWDNSNEPAPRGFNEHAIVKIDLETAKQTKLMELGWEFATHITAPIGPLGWCIVSTYDNATGGDLWRVWLDARPAEHLLAHGSDSSTYEGQPHASISRDGHWLAYNRRANGITDVYLAELDPTQPEPTSLTWQMFPNQTALTFTNFPAKPGEAGFVYDGGDDTKLIWHDGTHKWFISMKLIK